MSEPYRVRASSWGALFDCAHRWEGVNMLGMRMPSSPRAALGTAIHAGTAHYDLARINGQEPDQMEAGEAFLQSLDNPREEVSWRGADINKAEAQKIGLTLLARYCTTIAPQFEYAAVEMETKPLVIDCGGGVNIQLTGTMDRARILNTAWGVGIADVKTGTRATEKIDAKTVIAKTKGFAPQIGTYELLYEHTTGEPVTGPGEIIGLNTSTLQTAVGEIKNARDLLIGTEERPGLMQYAAVMFRTGMFPPNPQSTLCSERYCARWHVCKYHY